MEQQIQEIERESTQLVKTANEFVILTQGQYEATGDFLKMVKGLQKKVTETFDPIV